MSDQSSERSGLKKQPESPVRARAAHSSQMMPSWDEDYYGILGIEPTASTQEIDKAYWSQKLTSRVSHFRTLSADRDAKKRFVYADSRSMAASLRSKEEISLRYRASIVLHSKQRE